MSAGCIEMVPDPGAREHGIILGRLADFNLAKAGSADAAPLCFVLRNADGEIDGGLWGTTMYQWLAIELVFVPEVLRGHGAGAELVRLAEAEAQLRGCIGAWLDTFSFQARFFYEKLGYRLAGQIDDHPPGGARYFLSKTF
jgi:GNAT superfamily N-acetyltransferase